MPDNDSTTSPTIPSDRFPIEDEPGYYADKDGSIWSCLETKNFKWKKLKPSVGTGGVRIVGLYGSGKGKMYSVHRLILEAFIGKCPDGMICKHLDGDKTNSELTNLAWVPRSRLDTGSKRISSQGYIEIKVKKGHHLAHSLVWAFEHRIIAEQKIGRKLTTEEQVHHINEDRTDNRPENLKVVIGNKGHKVYHRKRNDLRMPDEYNPMISCGCGCGELFLKYDSSGRPRKVIQGHSIGDKQKLTCDSVREIRRLATLGVPHSEIAKMFNIDKSAISRIHNRKTWSRVE